MTNPKPTSTEYRPGRHWYEFTDSKDRNAVIALIAAVGAFVLAGKFTGQLDPQRGPARGHDKVYVARPGDTEWTIAQRAYPHLDPREVIDMINKQEPAANRAQHIVAPGEEFYFAQDASIGQETK